MALLLCYSCRFFFFSAGGKCYRGYPFLYCYTDLTLTIVQSWYTNDIAATFDFSDSITIQLHMWCYARNFNYKLLANNLIRIIWTVVHKNQNNFWVKKYLFGTNRNVIFLWVGINIWKKFRTIDFAEFRNFEYYKNERWVIRFI